MWEALFAFHICIACSCNRRDLGQPVHLQIAFGSPFGSCHMPQSCRYQHQGALPIGERTDHARSSTDLPHRSFQWVVGAQAAPVFGRHRIVAQRLLDACFDDLRGPGESHLAQLGNDLTSLFFNCLGVSCAWMALSIAATSFTLPVGTAVHTLR